MSHFAFTWFSIPPFVTDGTRVLVVEDEAPVRRLVARVLATAGYQMKVACPASTLSPAG